MGKEESTYKEGCDCPLCTKVAQLQAQLDQRTADYDRALELAEAIGKDRDRERAEKKEILLTFKREYKLLLETFKYAKRMLRNVEEDVDTVYVDTTMQRANQQLEALAKAEGKDT